MKRYTPLILIGVLLVALAFKLNPVTTLTVYAADIHNNDINYIEVWQWNGTHYNLLANFTSSEQSVRVVHEQPLNFTVGIQLNSTLASSVAEAIAYTRCYMNISGGVWTNEELNNTSCSLSGNFYYLTEMGHWNSTGLPAEGVDYDCAVLYEDYS